MPGFRVATYNIHRCIGTDDRYSPERIIDIIGRIEPDIVALQEVDEESYRSGGDRQALLIAGGLEMEHRFLPTLEVEGGHCGIALLSRHPGTVVKEAVLTPAETAKKREARGAIWSSISLGPVTLQVLTVHLGLTRRERRRQADILLGTDWLQNPSCSGHMILMGDLNSGPRSAVYRRISRHLTAAQRAAGRKKPAKTWPSRFPLFSLDHIFVSSRIRVVDVRIPREPDYRRASDHLPVIADVEIDEHERTGSETG